ncbi:MAG: hypothetical protein A2Z20_13050 [Bdellovibrionales bacterium RBG_16_40_8]|nr:MAG: hypothetical protein A2Z20_13050 [Bdellovibrionales bacterium RBG_16_40_8]
MTRKFIFIFTYLFLLQLYAANLTSNAEIKMACKAASAHMPNGNGFAIYYPNGRLLTPSAGRPNAVWYYANGIVLTSSVGTPGALFYYSNGRVLSPNFGIENAPWYYSDGRLITTAGPRLTSKDMAEIACDLISSDYSL